MYTFDFSLFISQEEFLTYLTRLDNYQQINSWLVYRIILSIFIIFNLDFKYLKIYINNEGIYLRSESL